MVTPRADFFISRAGPDSTIAKVIAKTIEAAGYSTILQDWDFGHADFVAKMDDALSRSDRVITVLSRAYLGSEFCGAEWRSVFARDPRNFANRLLLFRVEECQPTGLLCLLAFTDLTNVLSDTRLLTQIILARIDLSADKGAFALLESYQRSASSILHPHIRPVPNFVGRQQDMESIGECLHHGDKPAVLTAFGGVGKSALATEYGYQHRSEFSGVWFVDGSTEQTIQQSLISLGDIFIRGLKDTSDSQAAVSATRALLRQFEGRPWLIVFDNVSDELELRELAGQAGIRLLATSRANSWGHDVFQIELPVLSTADAVGYLRAETGRAGDSEEELVEIASKVGCLPLALSHSAMYLRRAKAVSLRRFIERLDELIAKSPTLKDEPASVRATYRLAIEQAESEAAGATELMKFVSFFEGMNVPLEVLEHPPELYPETLQSIVRDERAREDALSALVRLSLIQLDILERSLRTHVLVASAALPTVDTTRWYLSVMRALYFPFAPTQSLEAFERPRIRTRSKLGQLSFEQIARCIGPGIRMDLSAFKYGAPGRLVALGIFQTWDVARLSEDEWSAAVRERSQEIAALWEQRSERIEEYRIAKGSLAFDHIRRNDLRTAAGLQYELCAALYADQKSTAILSKDKLATELKSYVGMARDLGAKTWEISSQIASFEFFSPPFDHEQLLSDIDLDQPAFVLPSSRIRELAAKQAVESPPDPAVFLHRLDASLVNAGMPRRWARSLAEFLGNRLGTPFEHLISVPANSGVLQSDEALAKCVTDALSEEESYEQAVARLEADLRRHGASGENLEILLDNIAGQLLVERRKG